MQSDPFDDFFAGSEPVAPTPEDAQTAPAGEAQMPATPEETAQAAQAAELPANVTAALLNLHARIQQLEKLAQRNGWALERREGWLRHAK